MFLHILPILCSSSQTYLEVREAKEKELVGNSYEFAKIKKMVIIQKVFANAPRSYPDISPG